MSLLSVIEGKESAGGTQLYNPIPTSSGNASGLYGITSGTWSDFAPNVPGASAYSSAQDAPDDIQSAVANYIPIGRWAASTQAAVAAAGYDISNPLATVGSLDPVSSNGSGSYTIADPSSSPGADTPDDYLLGGSAGFVPLGGSTSPTSSTAPAGGSTAAPQTTGSTAPAGGSTTAPQATSFYAGAEDAITNFFGRTIIVIIGLVCIAGGVYLMRGDNSRDLVTALKGAVAA